MNDRSQVYAAFPVKEAPREQCRTAIILGRFLHRAGDVSFYSYKGDIYVVSLPERPAPDEYNGTCAYPDEN